MNDAAHTPHLDALREGGVELTRHITASSCSPSRSALLSGREPIHVNELTQASTVEGAGSECICGHGTRSMQRFVSSDTGVHDGMMRALVVPADMTTIAEKLKTAGYATAQIGKWHVGSSSPRKIPSGRGFDESYGSIGGHTDHYTSMRDVVGCGEFPDLWRTDGPAPLVTGGDYVGTHYVNEAVRIINDHDAAAAPLFLYVALQQPHTPLDVPDSYLTPFEDGVGNDPSWNLRKKYLGLVNFLDEALGLIEDALTANSMYSDTLSKAQATSMRVFRRLTRAFVCSYRQSCLPATTAAAGQRRRITRCVERSLLTGKAACRSARLLAVGTSLTA